MPVNEELGALKELLYFSLCVIPWVYGMWMLLDVVMCKVVGPVLRWAICKVFRCSRDL